MPAPMRKMPAVTAPDGLLDPTVCVTLPEAAGLCRVPKSRVRYRLTTGKLPGAHRLPGDASRRWVLPIGDLVAAGLLDPARVSRPSTSAYAIGLAAGTLHAVPPAPAPDSGPAPAHVEPPAGADPVEHARLVAQVEALTRALADRDAEVAFLRGLLTTGRAA